MRLLQLRPVCLECYVGLRKRAVGVNGFAVVTAHTELIDRIGFLLIRRNRLPSEPSVNLSAHSARQKLKRSEFGYSEKKRRRKFFLLFPLKFHSSLRGAMSHFPEGSGVTLLVGLAPFPSFHTLLRVISLVALPCPTVFCVESHYFSTPNPLFIIARPLPDILL